MKFYQWIFYSSATGVFKNYRTPLSSAFFAVALIAEMNVLSVFAIITMLFPEASKKAYSSVSRESIGLGIIFGVFIFQRFVLTDNKIKKIFADFSKEDSKVKFIRALIYWPLLVLSIIAPIVLGMMAEGLI